MTGRGVRAAVLCWALGLLAGAAGQAVAQTGWSAHLVLPPLPSPYLSDWEMDPGAATLTVTNGTSVTTDITFHYSLTRGSQMLLRGVTDPHTIAAGATETFDATSSFGGRADWDQGMQDLVARTGRLPEGEFEGCVTIADPGGLVLVARQCVRFTTLYPDPPALVFPLNGDSVITQDPIFEWLPVQLPPLGDGRIGYVLHIAEVRTEAGQLPEVALATNIPHVLEPGLTETAYEYPIGSLPFVPGRLYAWRVQALDGDGRPVASNQGRSEVWTFVYREPAAEVQPVVASIALTPLRDTLRYAGDTARYEARAYDADNLEILGKRIAWRSLDTNVVRVDTLGVVTGVRAGETGVVATVDGVSDTAHSVTRAPTEFAVRFERYDPETEKPPLLALLESGSFDEVVPKLMELLQSGEFRIPVPRLPGFGGVDVSQARTGEDDAPGRGPSRSTAEDDRYRAIDPCEDLTGGAEAHVDHTRKSWALEIAVTALMTCLLPESPNQPRWVAPEPDTAIHRSVLLAVSWRHPGVPRVFVARKGVTQLPPVLPLAGTQAVTGYWVLNLSRTVTLESDLLPADFAGFFGTQSFDVGTGLTLYYKIRCLPQTLGSDAEPGPVCSVLSTMNPDNPEITLHAFAGVTASETSVNTSGLGHSLALGFSIKGTLPVQTWDADVLGISLDSTQFGLMFAVQDSMVEATGVPRDNWSLGVAFIGTVWIAGSGKTLQIDASAGLEWDPTKTVQAGRPKLVLSAQLAQILKAWPVRLGNPQLVFTTPIGSRREREASTLQMSGTWGFGPNEGLALAGGGGDVRNDIGGGATGGGEGFEEMGRGQITLAWSQPPTQWTKSEAMSKWQDARKAFTEQEAAQEAARRKHERAQQRVELAQSNYNPGVPTMVTELQAAQKALLAAESELATANVQLENARADREQTRLGVLPPTCWKTVKNRCLNWSGSLSVGNGSLADVLMMIMRSAGSQ